ncbi:15123_t:CDS:1 [Funneliformis mosseae]|uniref:15123_t:CDS:1 n=1 Tax=Funneliformis mosseae TaxID=27381 RepID=A0A9N9FSM5_FUNMO|nr:15123_t:CDS:1 [Funneliformis mosseae]
MSFPNQAALMISKSESIIQQLRNNYPNLSQLLMHNREGTVGFLKANGGLFGFSLCHDFHVPHTGSDNIKAWSDYRDAIEKYLEEVCGRVIAKDPIKNVERSFKEELREARKVLSNEIHRQHYIKFPLWPSSGEQTTMVELDTGSAYNKGAYTLVWSCVGWIKVTDKRPQSDKYIAEFSGKPDLKLLVLDNDRLRELEDVVRREGIEAGKRRVGRSDYLALTWDQLL